jgi:hypothetical protein
VRPDPVPLPLTEDLLLELRAESLLHCPVELADAIEELVRSGRAGIVRVDGHLGLLATGGGDGPP